MKFTLTGVALVLAAVTGLAQTTSTSILGTVTDSSGAIVDAATVTIVDTGTGVKRELVTSNTGDFNFPLLNVGTYDVSVSKQGFKTESRRGIVLELNQKA